jgi:hypothetical protein
MNHAFNAPAGHSCPLGALLLMKTTNPNTHDISEEFHSARCVAAVCAAPEAAHAERAIRGSVDGTHCADLLWLTWVQWRAMGREATVRHTGLSLWTLNDRLRRIREAGVPVCSTTEERDLLGRGRFHAAIWE